MAPRKVTFNLDEGVFVDATAMMGLLGHKTMSSLVEAAVEAYVMTHGTRLHNEWVERVRPARTEGTAKS